MAGAVRGFARLAGQGLSLAAFRRPRSHLELAGFGAFLAAWSLVVLAVVAQDAWLIEAPRVFNTGRLWIHAGIGFAWLAAAWLTARVLHRPAAWSTLACLAAIAAVPWIVVETAVQTVSSEWTMPAREAARAALLAVTALVPLCVAAAVGQDAPMGRRFAAGLLLAALLAVPWQVRAAADTWYRLPPLDEPAHGGAPSLGVSTEVLLGRQPALVAQRAQALAPQDPAKVDLYAVGFAGDGNEAVFRNEVEYFDRLVARRFGATGHVVPLINHPATVGATPLATLANLRTALAGVGTRMDREQDVLLLFVTSHGSPDHQLAVDLPPLDLQQIEPKDLRKALDDAGIKWRVVVVSACFSGGFIDALRTPETLVITAARADRTSFGCGADSEITWFGKAFLAEALNRTTDLREAYAIAARRVREWEREDGATPSQPQIWAGERIDAHLAQWRATLVPGAPVAFVPAVPARGGDEGDAPR